MREKLIELMIKAYGGNTTFETIADNLLANGVIVLPCKVGDTVYVIDRALKAIDKRKVSEIRVTDYELYVASFGSYYPSRSLGKTVFLTREDAEKALKEGQKGTGLRCDGCKIHAEMPLNACCIWFMDQVILGDKTPEECPEYVPLDTEKGGEG